MVFGRPHLFAGGFSWNAIVKNLLFCVFSFPVIGPVFYVSFLCLIVCLCGFHCGLSVREICTGPGDGCSVGLFILLTDGSSAKSFMLG